MSQQVDAAFLALLTHGSELLRELNRGDLRIEGPLRVRLDGFKAAHSQAMNAAKYVAPESASRSNGGVFDGGPVSNPPAQPQAAAAPVAATTPSGAVPTVAPVPLPPVGGSVPPQPMEPVSDENARESIQPGGAG